MQNDLDTVLLNLGLGLLGSRGSTGERMLQAGLLAQNAVRQNAYDKAEREREERERQKFALYTEEIRRKREAEEAATRRAQDVQSRLSGAFGGDLSQMGPGGPTPENLRAITPARLQSYRRMADIYSQMGMTEEAKRMDDIADRAQESFGQTPQTLMQDGRPVAAVLGNRGTVKPLAGYEPKPETQMVNLGDRTMAADMLRMKPGTEYRFGVSDVARAQMENARAIRDAAKIAADAETQRAREAMKEQNRGVAETVLGKIAEIRDVMSTAILPTTGWAGNKLKDYAGTAAHDINQLLEPIRANISFTELNKMRAASKTGAALGSVQVRELEMLMNRYASLEQSQTREQFLRALQDVENGFLEVIHGPEAVRGKRAEQPNASSDSKGWGKATVVKP